MDSQEKRQSLETPRHYHERVLVERYAERAALLQVRGASFTHCLKLAHIPSDFAVTGKMGEKLTLHAKDIANQKTWARFLREEEANLEWFSYQVGGIATTYARWLRQEYTSRYRLLETNEALEWLKQVTRLAVLWHMMAYKYERHTFLDPWVESEMGKLLLLRDFCREMAKAVHHAIKDQGQAVELLEQAYERSLTLIEDRPLVPYEAPVALPEGVTDPLAWPAQEHEQHDE